MLMNDVEQDKDKHRYNDAPKNKPHTDTINQPQRPTTTKEEQPQPHTNTIKDQNNPQNNYKIKKLTPATRHNPTQKNNQQQQGQTINRITI